MITEKTIMHNHVANKDILDYFDYHLDSTHYYVSNNTSSHVCIQMQLIHWLEHFLLMHGNLMEMCTLEHPLILMYAETMSYLMLNRLAEALALATMTHPPAGFSDCLSFKMLERPNRCYGPAKTHWEHTS